MAPKPIIELDGMSFDTLESFYDEVDRKLVTAPWGHNLDAFNDILRGGFGTPEGGFVLRWLSSTHSQAVLSHAYTVRYLEQKVRRCHPDNVPHVRSDIAAAQRGEGQTVFDILVEIIRDHGPGGAEAEDGVELELA